MFKKAALTAVISTAASPLFAQGFSGGDLSMEFTTPTENTSTSGSTYSGGLEYSINRSIAVAVTASRYSFGNSSAHANNATLHGVYHMNEDTSVGFFAGRDSVNSTDVDHYGFEVGTDLGSGNIGGYFGQALSSSDTINLLGADGSYDFTNQISLNGTLDHATDGSESYSKATVGVGYQMTNGPELFGNFGTVLVKSGSSTADANFLTLGARIDFGASRGTTFGSRGIFEAFPSF